MEKQQETWDLRAGLIDWLAKVFKFSWPVICATILEDGLFVVGHRLGCRVGDQEAGSGSL